MFLLASVSVWGMEDDRLEALGKRVVAQRIRLKMRTSAALAKKMGVSARLLGDIENGRRRVSASSYSQLENALEWREGSVENFLDRGAEPTPAAFAALPMFLEKAGAGDAASINAAVVRGDLREDFVLSLIDTVALVLPHIESHVPALAEQAARLRGELRDLWRAYVAATSSPKGGDGHADANAGGSASTIEFNEFDAQVEVREADTSTRRRGAPE